ASGLAVVIPLECRPCIGELVILEGGGHQRILGRCIHLQPVSADKIGVVIQFLPHLPFQHRGSEWFFSMLKKTAEPEIKVFDWGTWSAPFWFRVLALGLALTMVFFILFLSVLGAVKFFNH
ncbi:MAG: hypothetical protein NZ480_04065, partial [Bdellovibrionaceae bacterium]|nr:hypothetical protein [Pseudobdellovibrionaceae bacterium]